MPSRARSIAAEVLRRVERDDAYANVALEAALSNQTELAGELDPRDAALASELVLGTLRRQLALDAVIEKNAQRSMDRLERDVRPLLRMGAYQLIYLDRVPARAAVHETVELCKASGLGRAAGLANAVLRSIARDPTVPLPEEPLERLSIEESHPLWLVRRWTARLGFEEAAALCRANNQPAPLSLRVNLRRNTPAQLLARLRAERPDATIESGQFAQTAIALQGAGPPGALPGYREGAFQVQDEAAQLVGCLVSPAEGAAVVDVCAAPGGKSCHLAEQGASVLAMDLAARKLKRVESEAARLGLDLCCVAADGRDPLPVADRSQAGVLVDAPCSGLGTLRRHPELRYRRTVEDLSRLADLQWEILARGARAVAPGGTLVFAVCSSEPEEGLAHRERLLAEFPEFRPAPPPDVGTQLGRSLITTDGALATWPHRHGLDGFTAFRVRRQ